MTLNEKLVSLYKSATDGVRAGAAYKLNRSKIENELIARCSKGNTTQFRVSGIAPTIITVLARDLRAEGLHISIINGHEIEASVNLTNADC